MTVRTPDQAAILAAANFEAMPPLPRTDPAPPASASSCWSTSTISSISDAVRVEPGIGGEHAGRVGEQHEDVGVDEVGHERGQPVVVAEPDLVVGDGVVLVHDRHHPELEQAPQRAPRLQVLAALHEVERGDQHLPGDQAVAGELVAVHLHQPALAHRGHRLQGDRVTRPLARRRDRGRAARRRSHRC